MADSEADAGDHNNEINLSHSAESRIVNFDMQPGPSLSNQRASVIVVQPTSSSEIRIDSVVEHTADEIQVVEIDHSSRESLPEATISSPVFSRRRRRGKILPNWVKYLLIFHSI